MPPGILSSIRRASGLDHLRLSEDVVIFERAEDGGWGASLPDLPGVVSIGESREVVAERIQEAVQAYADELRELGQVLPEPLHAAGTARI